CGQVLLFEVCDRLVNHTYEWEFIRTKVLRSVTLGMVATIVSLLCLVFLGRQMPFVTADGASTCQPWPTDSPGWIPGEPSLVDNYRAFGVERDRFSKVIYPPSILVAIGGSISEDC